jgi:hypothetical protein
MIGVEIGGLSKRVAGFKRSGNGSLHCTDQERLIPSGHRPGHRLLSARRTRPSVGPMRKRTIGPPRKIMSTKLNMPILS